jgi:hypothetical protein
MKIEDHTYAFQTRMRVWWLTTPLMAGTAIAYRCNDGSFPVSASELASANPTLLPSSETGVNLGTKQLKKALI